MDKKDTGGAAFPRTLPTGEFPPDDCLRIVEQHAGMTLRDYAAIKFAAAWVSVLGAEDMRESRDDRTAECNRLGLLQADDFMESRK